MKGLLKSAVLILVSLVLTVAPASAYDQDLAAGYAKQYATVNGAKAGKHLHLIKVADFVKSVRSGQPITTIDVRTPGETRFFTANLPGHLVIPLAELFKPESLARLPTDRTLVVLCKSGVRATAAATALRRIGFDEVYVLKGGLKGLAAYLGPKEANQPLGPKTAAR